MKSVRITAPKNKLSAELSFPGDKSLSHRAIMFGSLAEGTSSFTNVLAGEDCVCTRHAFEAMGVSIRSSDPTKIVIEGKGLSSLKEPREPLYLGNSGTSMRLLLGLLAGQPFASTLTGDPSLSSRPMRRVTDYIRRMGATVEGKEDANYAPLTVRGGKLKGIHAVLPVASAQVKSAILLAGLYAQGETSVTEPVKSRDHTERFLTFFGADINEEGLKVSVVSDQRLHARSFGIAGDISSAAFFMVIAALLPKSDLAFKSVLWNPTRTGIVDALAKAGVEITVTALNEDGPETTADFKVRGGALKAFELQRMELPALIDEIPILTVLATQAEGTTVIRDADELRVKETDRIRSMTAALTAMGAKIRAEGNTIIVDGPTPLKGARVNSEKDHRTAMASIVAGLIAEGDTIVEDIDCINTSFPNFFELLTKMGVDYELK